MAENLQSESLNALLRELAMSLKKLTHEETSLRQLDTTLDVARELHERIAILRFRAIEKLKTHQENIGGHVSVSEKDQPRESGFEQPISFSIRPETPTPLDKPTDSVTRPVVEDDTAEAGAEATHTDKGEAPVDDALPIGEFTAMSLADRLQLAPLQHLTDAMGINDRVRFAQELFGGDMSAFKAACVAIEGDSSEEAGLKTLKTMADPEVDWTAEKGPAADFVVLVSRLFVGKPA